MRKIVCRNCDGYGRLDLPIGQTIPCSDCDGVGHLPDWLTDGMLVLVAVLALVIGLLVGYWLRGDVEAYSRRVVAVGDPQPPLSVSVRPGDRLWTIAEEHYDSDRYDIRHVVYVIRQINPDLDPGRLIPGRDVVYLPRLEEVR